MISLAVFRWTVSRLAPRSPGKQRHPPVESAPAISRSRPADRQKAEMSGHRRFRHNAHWRPAATRKQWRDSSSAGTCGLGAAAPMTRYWHVDVRQTIRIEASCQPEVQRDPALDPRIPEILAKGRPCGRILSRAEFSVDLTGGESLMVLAVGLEQRRIETPPRPAQLPSNHQMSAQLRPRYQWRRHQTTVDRASRRRLPGRHPEAAPHLRARGDVHVQRRSAGMVDGRDEHSRDAPAPRPASFGWSSSPLYPCDSMTNE